MVHLYGQKQYGVDPTIGAQELRTNEFDVEQLVPVAGGKMLVRGWFNYIDNSLNTQGIARLDSAGRLDPAFNTVGFGSVSGIAVTATGELWISGSNGSANFFVRKLTPDGAVIPGVPAIPVVQNADVIATPDGGCYVFDSRNAQVFRYAADGNPKDGFATIALVGSELTTWAVGPQGEIALLIWGPWGNQLLVFSSTGVLQPTPSIPADFNAYSIAYDSIGRLIVSGAGTGQPKPVVLRLLQSGELDPTFSGMVPDIWPWISSIHVMPGGTLLGTGSVGGVTGVLEFSSDGVFQRVVSLTASGGQSPGTFYAFPVGTSEYVVAGVFENVGGITASRIAKVQFGGGVSSTFTPNLERMAQVNCLARSAGGEILFGGIFTRIGQTKVSNLAGLNPNGIVDTNFPPIQWANSIFPTQDGGTFILGSIFPPLPGTTSYNVVKLRGDRSVDTSFLQGISIPALNTALLLPDGAILLGGQSGPGSGSSLLTRVTPQGMIDPAFYIPPPASTWEAVTTMAVHPAGGYVVAGRFDEYQGESRAGVARVTSNGVVDHAFVPEAALRPDGWPRELTVLPDGRFYLLGRQTVSPDNYSSMMRFLADGTLDLSFAPAFPLVYSYCLAPDGSMFVAGGDFPGIPNDPITLVHVLSSGQLDPNFVFSFQGVPIALDLGQDGSLIVGGAYTQVNGLHREGLTRIVPIPLSVTIDGPASQNVVLRGSITLSAHAVSAAGPISYQWYFNGAVIAGAVTDKLEVNRVMPKDAGAYTVAAMSVGERARSPAVNVNVTKGANGH